MCVGGGFGFFLVGSATEGLLTHWFVGWVTYWLASLVGCKWRHTGTQVCGQIHNQERQGRAGVWAGGRTTT